MTAPGGDPAAPGRTAAVVLAGGRGLRAGGSGALLPGAVPKQFVLRSGIDMVGHVLAAFEESAKVDDVIVVVPEDSEALALQSGKVRSIVAGGETRQDSLAAGLEALPAEAAVVLVHDAARPCVGAGLIDAVAGAVEGDWDGAVPCLPVDEAIKRVGAPRVIEEAIPRSGLWRAQTPQGFTRTCIEESLAKARAAGITAEDCSEMATRAGFRIRVVEGDPANIKVTWPGDGEVAAAIMRLRQERSGG